MGEGEGEDGVVVRGRRRRAKDYPMSFLIAWVPGRIPERPVPARHPQRHHQAHCPPRWRRWRWHQPGWLLSWCSNAAFLSRFLALHRAQRLRLQSVRRPEACEWGAVGMGA